MRFCRSSFRARLGSWARSPQMVSGSLTPFHRSVTLSSVRSFVRLAMGVSLLTWVALSWVRDTPSLFAFLWKVHNLPYTTFYEQVFANGGFLCYTPGCSIHRFIDREFRPNAEGTKHGQRPHAAPARDPDIRAKVCGCPRISALGARDRSGLGTD